MDLRIIIRSEVGQTKININGIAYRWNLKKKKIIQVNLFIKQKQIYRHRKQIQLPKGKL